MRTKRTEYKHVLLWPDGTPTVSGTRLKVKFVANAYRHGATAEDIQESYPSHTLAEIFSALAYYLDHKEAMDQAWDEAERRADEYRAAWEQTEAAKRFREKVEAYRQRV